MAPPDLSYSKAQMGGSLRARHSRSIRLAAQREGVFHIEMTTVMRKAPHLGGGLTKDL